MVDLPRDIMIDILARFSVRDLVRFRCVSKTWCSLISQPDFVKTHLNRAIEDDDVNFGLRRRVLLDIYGETFQSLDYEEEEAAQNNGNGNGNGNGDTNAYIVLDFLAKFRNPETWRQVSMSKSCDGLVCINFGYGKIILCNPCTREFRELPKVSIDSNDDCSSYELGYDSSIDDYKVVRNVFLGDKYDKSHLEVFTLRTNSWRKIHSIHPTRLEGYGIYFEGAIHWITQQRETKYMIIPFDLATEEFKDALPLPDGEFDDQLLVLGGSLSTFRSYMHEKFEVWVMKVYGEAASWTKLFVIHASSMPRYDYYMAPLCFTKNGGLLMGIDCNLLRIYNPEEGRFTDLIGQHNLLEFSSIIYVESLNSPYGNNTRTWPKSEDKKGRLRMRLRRGRKVNSHIIVCISLTIFLVSSIFLSRAGLISLRLSSSSCLCEFVPFQTTKYGQWLLKLFNCHGQKT